MADMATIDALKTMVRTHAAVMLQALDALNVGDPGTPLPEPVPVQPFPSPESPWDPRLTQRGVRFTADPSGKWELLRAEYLDKEAAAGQHAIEIEALDANYQRIVGVLVDFIWPDGHDLKATEAKPGERWALSWPLFASGNGYSFVLDGGPRVEGMGLGSIEEPHLGIHVAYAFTFKRSGAARPVAQPEPVPGVIFG